MKRPLGAALLLITLGQAGATDQMPPEEFATRNLLKGGLKQEVFTLLGYGGKPVKMQISVPRSMQLNTRPWGEVSEEARGKLPAGSPVEFDLEVGIWQNAGMFSSTGATTTRRDGQYSITTVLQQDGDRTLRLTWSEPKIRRTLVCQISVGRPNGLSEARQAELLKLAQSVCKSFGPSPK